jgi:hypothetical protein
MTVEGRSDGGGLVSIVRLIRQVAVAIATPVPMMWHGIHWHFFLAVLRDLQLEQEQQKEEFERSNRGQRVREKANQMRGR